MDSWQITPYFYLYLLATVLAFILATLKFSNLSPKSLKYYRLLVLSTGVWSLGYLLGFFNTDLEWKLHMLRIEVLGGIGTVYFWFIFAISYTQYEQRLTKKRILFLAIIPIVAFISASTVKYHTFYYKSYSLDQEGGVIRFVKEYNIGFYIWFIYAYILNFCGAIILIWGMMHKPRLYIKQVIPIAVAAVMIIIPNLLYVIGRSPIYPYDPTPLSFMVIEIVFIFLLKRYHLFDLIPIAHHSVFKDVKSGVIIINTDNRILELNPAAEKIIGETHKTVLGHYLPDILPAYNKLIKDKNTLSILPPEEIEVKYSNNIFELQATPVFDDANNMLGNIVMLYNITQRKHALKELDAFASTVAHDLKSPLAIQASLVDLLTSEYLTLEESNEIIEEIGQGAKKMISIVDSLLLLSNVRNKNKIKIQPLNMNELVGHALLRLNNELEITNSQIIRTGSIPDALGYAPWVEEIWFNYIGNAIKYGGTPPVIEIGADQCQSHIRFWVKDNGDGLSSDEQKDIFKEFTRLKKHVSERKGYGLGLSIVIRIIERLDGKVGVESDGENGCKFYFTLRDKK